MEKFVPSEQPIYLKPLTAEHDYPNILPSPPALLNGRSSSQTPTGTAPTELSAHPESCAGSPHRLHQPDATLCARSPKPQPQPKTQLRRLVDLAQESVDAPADTDRGTRKTPSSNPLALLANLLPITSSLPAHLCDLVATKEMQDELKRCLSEHRRRKELYQHGLKPVRNILLAGPSGTGKSLFGQVLAGELQLPVYKIRLNSLLSNSTTESEQRSYFNKAGTRLRYLSETIYRNRAVYILEQTTIHASNPNQHDTVSNELFLFISDILRAVQHAKNDAIIIFSLPTLTQVPREIYQYFGMVLHFSLPDTHLSIEILQKKLSSVETSQIDWQQVMESSEGLCHAEIIQGAEKAAKIALLNHSGIISTELLASCMQQQQQLLRT